MVNPVDNPDVNNVVPTDESTEAPPPVPVEEEDPNAIKLNLLNQAAREIFDRIDPDNIAALVKLNPSGKESGGNNPFDVFTKVSGGGGGGNPGV